MAILAIVGILVLASIAYQGGAGLGGLLVIAAVVLIVPVLVRELWNRTLPELFGLQELRYGQAFRLWLLVTLLFGSPVVVGG